MNEVYKNNVEFTKIINKIQLNSKNMSLRFVSMKVTLKNNHNGIIKIYGEGEKGKIHVGTLPLIINMSRLENGTLKFKVFNPKTRLTIKGTKNDLHFTYEESIRYPTNIKGVEVPYKISGDFEEGNYPTSPKGIFSGPNKKAEEALWEMTHDKKESLPLALPKALDDVDNYDDIYDDDQGL